MNHREKIRQILKRAGLKHTAVVFSNFTKVSSTYTFPVRVHRQEFYSSQDRLSTDYVCKKIKKFNSLVEKEIIYADVKLSCPTVISSNDEVINLRLRIKFKKTGEFEKR